MKINMKIKEYRASGNILTIMGVAGHALSYTLNGSAITFWSTAPTDIPFTQFVRFMGLVSIFIGLCCFFTRMY